MLHDLCKCLPSIASMITVKLKSRITFLHRANFLKIDKGDQTLPLSAHEMAPMRAFSILQKWPEMA